MCRYNRFCNFIEVTNYILNVRLVEHQGLQMLHVDDARAYHVIDSSRSADNDVHTLATSARKEVKMCTQSSSIHISSVERRVIKVFQVHWATGVHNAHAFKMCHVLKEVDLVNHIRNIFLGAGL